MFKNSRFITNEIENSLQVIPFEKGSGNVSTLAKNGWDLLKEEVSFPVAVIKEQNVQNNAKWMQKFSQESMVELAPHGKTTMAPELFKLQIEQGCWGISLATVPQVINASQHGIKRIILANQLIGAFHFKLIADLLTSTDLELYCFVDSAENIHQLGKYFSQRGVVLKILLEIGVEGGRCGWRNTDNVDDVIEAIGEYDCLALSGVSFYEGVIHGEQAQSKIENLINNVYKLTTKLHQQKLFTQDEVIITGAGSAWYDVVASQFKNMPLISGLICRYIIRPGCYLIHDTGIYQQAQNDILQRSQFACDIEGKLDSSLEIWAYVQSIPEPGLVIIGLGKRDVAFDAGLPTPEMHYKPEWKVPQKVEKSWQVVEIMDQHCMMKVSSNSGLSVGDLIVFSTSHPCLTIDKWRKLGVINNEYTINKTITTYF